MQGAVGTEQDDPLPAPRPSVSAPRVGEYLRRAPGHVHSLQLTAGEKSEKAAVRGPERAGSPLGPRKRLRDGGFERPDPEPAQAIGRACSEGNAAAVWRHGRWRALECELRLLGREDR